MTDTEYEFSEQDGYSKLILVSPNGTKWRLKVTNLGILLTEEVP